MNSTDKTHGKPGHRCSTLCGAAMLRIHRAAHTEYRAACPSCRLDRVEVRSSDTYEVQR